MLKEVNYLVKLGNYAYGDLMIMPVYIRRFMLKTLQESLNPKDTGS
ncbi:hypothetical protein N9994_00010 [bacterium]|nr:hypothetical protein [bacterium]